MAFYGFKAESSTARK